MDEDARYRTSSQYRNWSFTPASLHALRVQTNALAVERNKAAFARRAHVAAQNASSNTTSGAVTPAVGTPAHGSTPAPSDGASTPAGNGAVEDIQYMTVEEELVLLRMFGVKVLEIGDHLSLPTDIKATALQFFHRFYLHNSFMTYPPIPILKTCLFLACKAEHHGLSLNRFCSQLPKTSPADVIGPEFLLTQSLKFNLDVRHPLRALEGAVMEIQNIVGGAPALPRSEDGDTDMGGVDGGSDKEQRVMAAHGRAREALKTQALLTDVYFHYTPSQIMLAALFMADAGLVQWYLGLKFPDEDMRGKVARVVQACAEMMGKSPATVGLEEEQIRELKVLNKKLKKCQDPEKSDLAKLKQMRQEKRNQMDQEEEERKAKKRKMEKEKTANDDPFGAPLPQRA